MEHMITRYSGARAYKGCLYRQIRSFEKKIFGAVDEAAFKSEFGC